MTKADQTNKHYLFGSIHTSLPGNILYYSFTVYINTYSISIIDISNELLLKR